MTRYALGIDSGATNMRIGLVDDQGTILKETRVPTVGLSDPDRFVLQLQELTESFLEDEDVRKYSIEGLGIGSSGQINREGELFGYNGKPILDFVPVPIRARLEETLRMPVRIVNDAQAAVYAEALYGAGKGRKSVVGLTIGTGIGGGIVIDRQIWQGAKGLAGHLGFLIIDFEGEEAPSEVPGPAEDFGSGTSIGRIARKWVAADREAGSAMLRIADGDLNKVSGFTVFEAAKQNDPLAQKVVAYCGKAIGAACASIIHAFNPDVIVLSGGVADQGDMLLDPIRDFVRKHCLWTVRDTPLGIAELGSRAGIIGSAALMFDDRWQQ